MAELELMRDRGRGEHDKLERLEVCTESLVKGMQLEYDKVCSGAICISVMWAWSLHVNNRHLFQSQYT